MGVRVGAEDRVRSVEDEDVEIKIEVEVVTGAAVGVGGVERAGEERARMVPPSVNLGESGGSIGIGERGGRSLARRGQSLGMKRKGIS